MRIGYGYDIHRLVAGRKLVLAGVDIPSPVGEEGHSDGDALIHAIIDALLGACSLGDIGSHFPPSDPAYKDISSRILLKKAMDMIREAGWCIENVDTIVILQSPRILPYVADMKRILAADMGIALDSVSIKGKTKESLDATGEGRAVEAYAVALLAKHG